MKRSLNRLKDWAIGFVSLLATAGTGDLPPVRLPDSLEVPSPPLPELGVGHEMTPDRLYELFEDVFRGSTDKYRTVRAGTSRIWKGPLVPAGGCPCWMWVLAGENSWRCLPTTICHAKRLN